MANVRIPQNQIISKYTAGNEYMLIKTQNEYKGYYYELNNKTFAGKTFDPNNPEIVKIKSDKFNKLLSKASTYAYGAISGTKIPNTSFNSLPITNNFTPKNIINEADSDNNMNPKFYCKKINIQPYVIKEVNESDYKSLQQDPLYQTTYTGTYQNKTQNIDQAEKQLPGIKAFLGL